jgi:hypothetical protein
MLIRIVATLGLKEITQGTLIRSIYTLRYPCDPQLERTVRRSQNRIESYHQLGSAIAQVGGKRN